MKKALSLSLSIIVVTFLLFNNVFPSYTILNTNIKSEIVSEQKSECPYLQGKLNFSGSNKNSSECTFSNSEKSNSTACPFLNGKITGENSTCPYTGKTKLDVQPTITEIKNS